MSDADIRARFLATIEAWASRSPPVDYIFDGKNPDHPTGSNSDPGLDCSGCYTRAMVENGLASEGFELNHNSQDLANLLAPIDEADAQPGDAVFYGPDWNHVDHIMALCADGSVAGASGAGSDCRTIQAARAKNPPACVHHRSGPHYRKDLLGFRSLPVDGLAT